MTDVTLTIDDKSVTVPKGTTVYNATKKLGIDIPIFCYQDRMPPFGACRVCLVEVDKMPKLQTSCTLEVAEGMVVRTQAHPAVKAREEILEFLLINHPLDCPICDRGGECPLQDQALKFGPGKSRFFEDKRRFKKPYSLGPVLTLDRERCITCARCTRFGDIVAGDHALEFIERGYRTEVGTADGGPAQSKFIGNTILICPVGALTSGVYRFRARPWDNDSTESTCTLCPVGCSMILDSRDGEIMRTRSQEKREVNDIWLCDKGWFGYEFSSSSKRLTQPLIRRHGELLPVSWDEAFSYVASKMHESRQIAALGGNNLTIEENYLLQNLVRDVLKSPHVDHRVGMPIFSLDDEGLQTGMQSTIGEIESLSHIVLLGLDITEEYPVIWLRLKAAINKGAKVFFAGHFAPECARYFESCFIHSSSKEALDKAKAFVDQHEDCQIFVGSQYLASADRKQVLATLTSWQKKLHIMDAHTNSMGARFAGMHPECGPMYQRLQSQGLDANQIIQKAAADGWGLIYAVGADLASKFPEKLWQQAREKIGCLVVQDMFMTKTAACADVVLPTLGFVEKGGSFLNIEGRVQKLKPGKAIPKGIHSDSYIFVKIAQRLKRNLVINERFLDMLQQEIIAMPREAIAQTSEFRQKEGDLFATYIAQLFDNGVRMKENLHLIQLAKEPKIRINPKEAAKRNLRSGDTVQIADISAKIELDDTVAERTVLIPLGFDALKAYELGPNLLNGQAVTLNNTKI